MLLYVAATAAASPPRSAAEILAFKRENPCPVTGERRGACPGWQIDHVHPLCLGGLDHRANMQWLPVADHQAKTRDDVRACRADKRPTL